MNTDTLFQTSPVYYHNLTFRFYPEEDIRIGSWAGAVFRNGFLHAARDVEGPQGETLYDILSQLFLPASHPYYKQLCGGFPKGFIWDLTGLPHDRNDFALERGHIYTATLRLIGHIAEYALPCCMAVERFFELGIGHPRAPLHLMDVRESGGTKERLIYNDSAGFLSDRLELPCRIGRETTDRGKQTVELRTLTPVCLLKLRRTATDIGYQEKLNGFPSFYQWTRTAAYRLYYLSLLYGHDAPSMELSELDTRIEEYLRKTYEACLLRADLRYRKLYSTPKKEKNGQVYGMDGYEGTLTFKDVSPVYLPLLRFMSRLGVGNDINYGLGLYEVINHINP